MAANLATLAVVVLATGWSAAQRPAQAPMAQVEQVGPALPSVQPAATQKPAQPEPLRVKADQTPTPSLAQAALFGPGIAGASLQQASYKVAPR